MNDRTRWWPRLTAAGLAALFLWNGYRAVTQSLAHDEAFTWQLYLRTPLLDIFTVYDNNNHFLSTLLMRLSTALFGFSEPALRLPSVLAGGWFLVTVFRLARLAFGDGPLLPLAAVLAAANPLVLDFLVAARGYSLALACLMFGIYCLVRWGSGTEGRGRLSMAGASLALAVTANLTVLIPVCVVTALVLAHLAKRRIAEWPYFLGPWLGILALFVAIAPVHKATMGHLSYGAHSLLESWRNLVTLSLAHNPGPFGWNQRVGWKAWWRGSAIVAGGIVSLAALGMAIGGLWDGRKAGARDRLLLIVSVTVVGSWAVLAMLHGLTGLPYPADRTGLYFLPLAGLLFPGLASALGDRPHRKAAARAVIAVGAVIAAQFLLQPNGDHFYIWRYDADTKSIVKVLAGLRGAGPMRVGISWPLEPVLNYYRETRALAWLPPFTREGPDGDYDYYILIEQDQDRIARDHLQVVYRGRISNTVIARRK